MSSVVVMLPGANIGAAEGGGVNRRRAERQSQTHYSQYQTSDYSYEPPLPTSLENENYHYGDDENI